MQNRLRKPMHIPMPLRYLINAALIFGLWFLLSSMIKSGAITNYWTGILITVGINIILAVSLNVGTGYLGQLPLGHAGFMAVGAYTGGIFMKSTPAADLLKAGDTAGAMPYIIIALVLSALIAGIFGLIIGIPALRLKGDYLAIITLGFGEIIRILIINLKDITGGTPGLLNIPKHSNFFVTYACLIVTIFVIHTVMHSRHGRAILSIRGNEIAAECCGINLTTYKVFAFALSAFFAGIAGAVYGGFQTNLFPSSFDFMASINILVMVVLGGMGSMTGAVIAATVLTALPNLMQAFSSYRMVIYSLLLIVVMIFKPSGLMGQKDISLVRFIEKLLNGEAFKSRKKERAEHE